MHIYLTFFLIPYWLQSMKKVKVKVASNSLWPHGLYSIWNSPGQNTWVGSLSLLQGIFPTQRSNPGLLNCGRILYQLSHKGSLMLAYLGNLIVILSPLTDTHTRSWSLSRSSFSSILEDKLCSVLMFAHSSSPLCTACLYMYMKGPCANTAINPNSEKEISLF